MVTNYPRGERACIYCGVGVVISNIEGCSYPGCNDFIFASKWHLQWPRRLGVAIRRFVRDAEVERLTEEAKLATRHARPCVPHADPDAEVCGCDVRRSRDAIDRLAALAKEGT